MPPFELWLQGRDDIFACWLARASAAAARASIPTVSANGKPAFGQYRPSETGSGYDPWALQVLEIADGEIVELTFFLDTERSSRCSDCRSPGVLARFLQDVGEAHEGDEVYQLRATRSQEDGAGGRRAASWSRASASTATASGHSHVADVDRARWPEQGADPA